jgi:hypothetical protein
MTLHQGFLGPAASRRLQPFDPETFIKYEDHVVHYRNSPEIIEAMDKYLLTGELPAPGVAYPLLPPD